MNEDDPNERPTLPAPDPFGAVALEHDAWPRLHPLPRPETPGLGFFTADAWEDRRLREPETRWWLEDRRRWLARWVLAIVGMAALVLGAALSMKLLLG